MEASNSRHRSLFSVGRWRGGEHRSLPVEAGEGLPAPSEIKVGLSEFLTCFHPVWTEAFLGNRNLSPNT